MSDKKVETEKGLQAYKKVLNLKWKQKKIFTSQNGKKKSSSGENIWK